MVSMPSKGNYFNGMQPKARTHGAFEVGVAATAGLAMADGERTHPLIGGPFAKPTSSTMTTVAYPIVELLDPIDVPQHRRTPEAIQAEAIAGLRRLAGSSPPDVAQFLSKLETSLQPKRPGPSDERRALIADRDAALCRLKRRDFSDMPARAAAKLMCEQARRYETSAYHRHRESGLAPTNEPQRTYFQALEVTDFPSAETLRRILAKL